jgi:cysteinyl-tRNA synthetase
MHTGPLRIDKEKMSKSLKNFITIKDAVKNSSSETLRFFLISSHYRSPLNYSEEGIKEAKNSLDRLYNSLKDLEFRHLPLVESQYSQKFHNAMQDDFNSPAAISVLFEMARNINNCKKENDIDEASKLSKELVNLSSCLGIIQDNPEEYFTDGITLTDQEVNIYITRRNQARAEKDFQLSDNIRDELLEKGIALEDKASGTVWKKI